MGRRAAVTVVVVAHSDRRRVREFLDSLAPALAPGDNVVLAQDPASLASPGAWRTKTDGGRLRAGASGEALPGWHDVVVVVEDRVLASTGWVDELAALLADPTVGAVAPRANIADGDELLVGIPYRPNELSVRATFLRSTVPTRRGTATQAERLAGPAIALRSDVLDRLGGPEALLGARYDPAAWSARVAAAGLTLVVAEGAYLHDPGGPGARPDPRTASLPLVSACLIVKDEEANLPGCLESMRNFADEVVVYDTGSLDSTREVAAALGARVVTGYWDDDFSRARNAALESCRGQWILWLDADETLVCDDPDAFRARLSHLSSDIEAYFVSIDNLRGTETATVLTHPACRLFRRAYAHWQGSVHEQVFARAGRKELTLAPFDLARISHRGYLQAALAGRAKGDRNLRTAFADLSRDSDLEHPARILSLGRSYLLAGRAEPGIELCRLAAGTASRPATRRLALRGLAEGLFIVGRFAEALEPIDALRACSANPVLADVLEGTARLGTKDYPGALAAFDRVRDGIDQDGFEYRTHFVAGPKAEALAALGRNGDATDTLLASLTDAGGLDTHLGLLVEQAELAGRHLAEIRDAIGPDRLSDFLPQLLQLKAAVAERVLDAWWEAGSPSRPLLATAARVALRCPVDRQLVWSARLRAEGLAFACPLVASSTDLTVEPEQRVLATATAVACFADERARLAFGASVLACAPESRAPLAAAVGAIGSELAARIALLPVAARPATPPTPARSGRRVLVLDRVVSAIRTHALAAGLARAGHAVTLLHPQPAAPSADLLAAHGVTVEGWNEELGPFGSWEAACARRIAQLYARQTFEVVVLAASAIGLLPRVRELLPLAAVVVDADSSALSATDVSGADLVVVATPAPEVRGTATCALSAPAVLAPAGPPPFAVRTGVCVVGATRAVDPAHLQTFATVVAPRLDAYAPTLPAVIVGDDPTRRLADALPSALCAGPLADPTPWMRSARVVVVAHLEGAEHWLAAAALCGTPALVVPADAGEAAALADAVAALASNTELWQAYAPSGAAAFGREGPDPLAALTPAPARETRRAAPPGRPEVRFVGSVFSLDSLAQVNHALATHLAASDPPFALSVLTPEPRPASRHELTRLGVAVHAAGGAHPPAALEIRHQWPPDFRAPREGRLVCIQPWEYGGLPAEWVGPLRDVVDELWVPTHWVRDAAVASGVPAERVHVVPNGVDTERFGPDGARYPLATTKATKFLFVGGCIERKGVDALLEAYLATFSADDDVCLVVKPYGSQSVYQNATLEPAIRQAAAGSGAEIEIVDEHLDADALAALYRSCDVLVHPYRGEGFGLPITEAMASGLPVIVPNGGACLDFCDETVAWMIDAPEVPIATTEWTPSVAGAWWLEPSRVGLADALLAAAADPAIRSAKGRAGRARILDGFTWEHAARAARARIAILLGLEAPAKPAEPARDSLEVHCA